MHIVLLILTVFVGLVVHGCGGEDSNNVQSAVTALTEKKSMTDEEKKKYSAAAAKLSEDEFYKAVKELMAANFKDEASFKKMQVATGVLSDKKWAEVSVEKEKEKYMKEAAKGYKTLIYNLGEQPATDADVQAKKQDAAAAAAKKAQEGAAAAKEKKAQEEADAKAKKAK